MIRSALSILAVAATVAAWPVFRPSNSERLTERGRKAFAEGRFGDAAASLDAAAEMNQGPLARFNQGTAKVAAGDAAGAPILEDLGRSERPVGGDALFNLGNSALLSRRFDDAIARYAEVLRRSPGDADAKRNLEIALRRKQQEEQRQQQQGNRGEQQPQPAPRPGDQEQQQAPSDPGEGKEQMSAEEILRSIAQQEKEELRRMRMRKTGEERPVGW